MFHKLIVQFFRGPFHRENKTSFAHYKQIARVFFYNNPEVRTGPKPPKMGWSAAWVSIELVFTIYYLVQSMQAGFQTPIVTLFLKLLMFLVLCFGSHLSDEFYIL